MDISKLPSLDADVARVLTLVERLLNTRREIEREAMRPDFSPARIAQLEAEQGALFRDLHRAQDILDAKTR